MMLVILTIINIKILPIFNCLESLHLSNEVCLGAICSSVWLCKKSLKFCIQFLHSKCLTLTLTLT